MSFEKENDEDKGEWIQSKKKSKRKEPVKLTTIDDSNDKNGSLDYALKDPSQPSINTKLIDHHKDDELTKKDCDNIIFDHMEYIQKLIGEKHFSIKIQNKNARKITSTGNLDLHTIVVSNEKRKLKYPNIYEDALDEIYNAFHQKLSQEEKIQIYETICPLHIEIKHYLKELFIKRYKDLTIPNKLDTKENLQKFKNHVYTCKKIGDIYNKETERFNGANQNYKKLEPIYTHHTDLVNQNAFNILTQKLKMIGLDKQVRPSTID